MEKGIIPILMGGLGNQMFIVASAFVASQVNGYKMYIFKNTFDNNKHNIHNLDYNTTIFRLFGIHYNISFRNINTIDEFKDYKLHSNNITMDGFDEWNPLEVKKGTIMNRYYQYYPVISLYENEIRLRFIKGLQSFLLTVSVDINSAFLHIRRGDYLSFSNIHYIQPLSYYKKCVDLLIEKNKNVSKIIVVSDDISWIKNESYFNNPIFHLTENLNELDTLALISQCKGGAICANSTFSWWGAFLGAYELRNPVFVPKLWINTKSTLNLFPPEWIVID